MRRGWIAGLAVLLLSAGIAGAGGPEPGGPATAAASAKEKRVLVFSRTVTFRHSSIPTGHATIAELGAANGFRVKGTEDPTVFRGRKLRRFDAVVFLNTTGDVLARRSQRALRKYVRGGGGYAGIHSAADTEHEWPWYGRLVGAYFESHPLQQIAWFDNEAPNHTITGHLASRFSTLDEFYSFKTNPREDVRVLLTIDESTYLPDPNTSNLPGGTPSTGYMGDHPMSWCHRNLGGRSFYTALGHEAYLYDLGWYRTHILRGIQYAMGAIGADCRARSAG